MKNPVYMLLTSLLIWSCSDKEAQVVKIDWKTELIGVGFIGVEKDSLENIFSYYPSEHNQPGYLKSSPLYKYIPIFNNDTVIFPTSCLYDFFRDKEIDNFDKDTSRYVVTKFDGMYKLTKIDGPAYTPNVFYYKKAQSILPEKFKYQFISGFDRWDRYDIEISNKDGINVLLTGNSYTPYQYEQDKMDKIDSLFISSYLNLVTERRYDTVSMMGIIICGASHHDYFIYDDSAYNYSTYFIRRPGFELILNYFRSKIDENIHGLEQSNHDIPRLKPKTFDSIPEVIQRIDVEPPTIESE